MTPEEIEKLPYRKNVGVVLLDDAGRVWVGQRADREPGQDAWQMPQGGVDKGEDPRAAALRELEEETGIKPHLVRLIAENDDWWPYDLPHDLVPHLWKGKYRGQKQKWFLMQFLGTDLDIDIHSHDQEFSDWKWLPFEEVPSAIIPFKRPVYEKLVAYFRPYI